MTGQIRARRAVTGEWLHQDVPLALSYTAGLNGKNYASAKLPNGFDVEAPDGLPMWYERGTVIYVEDDDGELTWCGLCSFSAPGQSSRSLEFGGMLSLYDLISFDGSVAAWEANPYDVVALMMSNAHAQPNGDLGITLTREGDPPGYAGDAMPPPRPTKPAKAAGQTRDDYAAALDAWQAAADLWDATYGDRHPYSLYWWDHKYIGDEARDLADSMGFEISERSTWLDRDALTVQHEMVVGAVQGTFRADLELTAGVNLVGEIAPATDTSLYGNDIIVLGAGEGAAMARGRASQPAWVVDDTNPRVRTTRLYLEKGATDQAYLAARAALLLTQAKVTTTLKTAKALDGSLPGLRPGDILPVRTPLFVGDLRVVEIARNNTGAPIDLTFDAGT